MPNSSKLIVVFGATGQTGGAVVTNLMRAGFRVRGVTRNTENPKSLCLAARGVDMVKGDLNDPDSMRAHLAGAVGVFSIQDFWEHGFSTEVEQGRALIDLAARAGIGHFVYSSVESAERGTDIPHFESKFVVENSLRESGLSFTILRPTFYMENLLKGDLPTQIRQGTLALALAPNKSLQLCAVDDIGRMATQVFSSPEQYNGRTIALAGDEKNGEELATAIQKAAARPMEFVELPLEVLKQFSVEMAVMFDWYDRHGHQAPESCAELDGPLGFEGWLQQYGSKLLETSTGDTRRATDWERDHADHSTSQKDQISLPPTPSRGAMGVGALQGKFCAINYVTVQQEYVDRFEHLFATRARAADALPGFIGMQILQPGGDNLEYLVVSWWDDEVSFTAWRNDPHFLKSHRGFADMKNARRAGRGCPMQSRFVTYSVLGE